MTRKAKVPPFSIGRVEASPKTREKIASLNEKREDLIKRILKEKAKWDGLLAGLGYDPRLINLKDIRLSVATRRALENERLYTLGDVCQLTEHDLLRIPRLQRRRLEEVKEVLAEFGLRLLPVKK